jgi:RNA 2',3'-cyclic 3'-phosphodiesterase
MMAEQLSFFDNDTAPRPPSSGSLLQKPKHVLFFAILPPHETAIEITERRQVWFQKLGLRGTLIAADRLHITLHPLGSYDAPPENLVAAACKAAASVAAASFDICFDRVITFKSTAAKKPVTLLPDNEIQPLMELERRLGAALAAAGLMVRPTPKLTPHITLAYSDGFSGQQAVDPVRWRVNEFALIHSHYGKTRHDLLGRWPLLGGLGSKQGFELK